MKKKARLQKKLIVRTMSFLMASMLLLLVIPFVALAAGKEEPEPGKKGDFRLFSMFYTVTQVTLEPNQEQPTVVSAEVGSGMEVLQYQWQAYSLTQEKYVDVAGQTHKEIGITERLASSYNYGNGQSYFRCQATVSDSDINYPLYSDVLTVALPKEEAASSQTEDTVSTVETIELTEPTLPGETQPTQPEVTEPTADPNQEEVTQPTQPEVTEPTTDPNQEEATEPTVAEETGEKDRPAEGEKNVEDEGEPIKGSLIVPQAEQEGKDSDSAPLRGMLLVPLRGAADINITFNLDGGSGVDNLTGLTTGESQLIGTPSKNGYIFTGWELTSPDNLDADVKTALENEADNGNLTVPEYSVEFKATWEEESDPPVTTQYTILYWVQNINDDGYTVYTTKHVSNVTSGTRQQVSESNLTLPSSTLSQYVDMDLTRSERGEKVINADGSTVFNLFYNRKTYTITFNVNTPTGVNYGPAFGSHSLTFNARYEQVIESLWPDESWVTENPRVLILGFFEWKVYYFQCVKSSDNKVFYNKPIQLTTLLLPNPEQQSYTFDLQWTTDSTKRYIRYRFQTLEQAKNGDTNYSHYVAREDIMKDQTVYNRNPSLDDYDIPGFSLQYGRRSGTSYYRYYQRKKPYVYFINADVNPVQYYYEQEISQPADPTKSGYQFDGWYYDPELTNPVNWNSIKMKESDMHLYAKWTKLPGPQSTVTVYNYKDDSSALQDQLTTITTPTGTPAKPDSAVQNRSRDGYRFVGWRYDDNGTEREFVFNSTVVNSNMTVYGKWTANNVTVTVYKTQADMNNGSPVLTIITTTPGSTAEANEDITGASLEGHTSSGWKTESGSVFVFDSTPVTENIKVYGEWTPNSYTLTIHFNNGINADITESVPYGFPIRSTAPSYSDWEGHDFGGWFANSEFTGDPVDWNTPMPVGGYHVYAKWNIKTFKVRFYYEPQCYSGDQITINPSTSSPLEYITVEYNSALSAEGYTTNFGPLSRLNDKTDKAFGGWYYQVEGSDDLPFVFSGSDGATHVTSDLNVYATWVDKEGSLTITNSSTSVNVFKITKSGDAVNCLRVVVPNGGSVTVAHLGYGTYTVTAETWGYKSTFSSENTTATINAPGQTPTVEFTGNLIGFNWLSGETRKLFSLGL